MKRALMIAAVMFVVVGVRALYWTRATGGNTIFSYFSYFVLFPGLFASPGIHGRHQLLPLFAISWAANTLVVILITEMVIGLRKGT